MEREFKHFVVFPSANPSRGVDCALKWFRKGYIPLVGLDDGATIPPPPADVKFMEAFRVLAIQQPFKGYYRVINKIVFHAFLQGAALVTCIGDDMDPPEQGAAHVADQYFNRFDDGYGVMQGCGDTQGKDAFGIPAAARICGSPTFGKNWAQNSYGSKGPFHTGYQSFYADEDLWNVAQNAKQLWLNEEITIFHKHWSWGHTEREDYHRRAQTNWQDDKALFERRKAAGFPETIE